MRVLLAKQRNIGADALDDLGDDKRHASQVRGPGLAFQNARDWPRINGHGGFVRIHVIGRRGVHHVHIKVTELGEVGVKCARVGVKVFTGCKLRRINKNRHDHVICQFLAAPNERQVSFVQGAHRHDQCARARHVCQRIM